MTNCVVLAPVLDRPHRARPVAESLGGEVRLVFLCSPGDDEEIAACRAVTTAETVVVPFEQGPGDYARKINYGVSITDEEWVFQGADDLDFHEGWLHEALRTAARQREPGVIGTQDLGNRMVRFGKHSTHSLVHRAYIASEGVVDGPGLMHEGYVHNFCDTEMVETAIFRRRWAFAKQSVVEHLHPHWHKGEMDATYEAGLSEFRADQLRFHSRRSLWRKPRR